MRFAARSLVGAVALAATLAALGLSAAGTRVVPGLARALPKIGDGGHT